MNQATQHALQRIADERYNSQIGEHGFTNEHALKFPEWYERGQQAQAAIFALAPDRLTEWPADWNTHYRDAIQRKHRMHQLAIAGALIVAELERLDAIKFDNITDVEPGYPNGESNWHHWRKVFIETGMADGMYESAMDNTDWVIARQEYFNKGVSAMEAYKRYYWENYN